MTPPAAPTPAAPRRSATARRLLPGLAALVALLAAASGFALHGVTRMREAFEASARPEAGAVLAGELASAVRDQYAHQAHTIIIGDQSHLHMYAEAEARVVELARRLGAFAEDEESRAAVADIERGSAELDAIFRGSIVPAVLARDHDRTEAEHARAQLVVNRIQADADRLVARFQAANQAGRAEARRVEATTAGAVIALLVGAPLLAALVALLVGRSVARPLSRLAAGADRLGAGDLSARLRWEGDDEFARLAGRLDAMAAAIEEREARLVQAEKLASLGRLAAGVAHEINNPLTVILGYVRLLRRKADAATAADLSVVEEEALRTKEIVDGLLDLARPPRLAPGPVDLRALGDEVVARLREAGALDGVTVRVDGAAAASADGGKVRQVVANLLRNAAEAAGPGGHVEVRVRAPPGGAEVQVHDSGPGLDPGARARLFEPFFTTKERGTGLGLAVSRAIARAHGGELALGTSPLGGAVATLTLPAGEVGP